jgi:diaminohydroxyphosphoribosylaminopyrimidine deaminase/5-amino-6-(5-phosphoribosylamino)uracil reductase
MQHTLFMQRCLELAALGRKAVGNGALVGSVLVRDGTIIAEGYHHAFGQAHAERDLLESFTGKIQPTDILYVNLEPCCHTGKQPPCTDIILERGVKHVVIGMRDPDSRVSGKGIEILRAQGVTVEGTVLRAECEWLSRGFISVRTKQRPWITTKMAKMADGRIANADGFPLAITSPEQNAWSHKYLRARHDAILVGVQTIINDNPTLDARLSDRPDYYPWRIILDPHGRIPVNAKVVTDTHASSTMIIVNPENQEKIEYLRKNGVHIFAVPLTNEGVVWEDLWKVLLGSDGDFHGVTSVLVEGGAKTWEMFTKANLVDMDIQLSEHT